MDSSSSAKLNVSNGLTWKENIPNFVLDSIVILQAIGGCWLTYEMKSVIAEIKNLQYLNYALHASIAILSMCQHVFKLVGFDNTAWCLEVAITILLIFAAIHRILRVSAFSISFVTLIKKRRDYGTFIWIIVSIIGIFASALPVITLFFIDTPFDQRFFTILNDIKIVVHLFILMASVSYYPCPQLLFRRKPFNITKSNAIDSKIHYCHDYYRSLYKLCALNGITSSIVSLLSEIVISHNKHQALEITLIVLNFTTLICSFSVKKARKDLQTLVRKLKRRLGFDSTKVYAAFY